MDNTNLLVAVVTAILAATPGILAFWSQMKKEKGDLLIRTHQVSLSTIDHLEKRIGILRTELEETRLSEAEARAQIKALSQELEDYQQLLETAEAHLITQTNTVSDLQKEIAEMKEQVTNGNGNNTGIAKPN